MVEPIPQVSSSSTPPQHETQKYAAAEFTAMRVRAHLNAFCGDYDGEMADFGERSTHVRAEIRRCIKEDLLDVVRRVESGRGGLHTITLFVGKRVQELRPMLPRSTIPQEELTRAANELIARITSYYLDGYLFRRDMDLMNEAPLSEEERAAAHARWNPTPAAPQNERVLPAYEPSLRERSQNVPDAPWK